jgi:Transposase DDE domain
VAGTAANHTRRTTPCGQARYSDAAIELVLMLRLVFHLALRQAEGFAASVLRLLGQELRVPDHTTLSRRSRSFAGRRPKVVPPGRMHLVIDSTGLKLFGQGEWDEEKHGRARRSWRKLHIAVDADTSEIVACVLTDNAADDAGQVPALLEQVEGEIASVMADGAYDGEPVYQAIAGHQPDPVPDIVIPPRVSAVPSTDNAEAQGQRDCHIRHIAEKGRMAWQQATR